MQNWHANVVQLFAANSPAHNVFAACGVITLMPLAIIVLMPRQFSPAALGVMVAFAAGTLLGDIMLHVVPFILSQTSHEHQHSHGGHQHDSHAEHSHVEHSHGGHNHGASTSIMLAMLGGLVAFMILDRFIRELGGGHSHSHSHSHDVHDGHNKLEVTAASDVEVHESSAGTRRRGKQVAESKQSPAKRVPEHQHNHHHDEVKSSGYLTMIANLAHTFTDGLTLAAAHYASPTIAVSTTLAVLLHEIPHKVGDYAIMLHAGFSKPVAVLMQLWSAAGTVTGALFGIWLQGDTATQLMHGMDQMIIPFAAGGLLYTATVGILPELLETRHVSVFAMQVVAMCCGISAMAWIAVNE